MASAMIPSLDAEIVRREQAARALLEQQERGRKAAPQPPGAQPQGISGTASAATSGRALEQLHVGYETVESYPVEFKLAKPRQEFAVADYRVTQMKFAKGANGEKYDKTTVIYNSLITMTGIPLEAYDYIVNGKSALEWVMERQAMTTHKNSGIVNDANDWAIETMNNPRYPLELFQRVITVSLKTMAIVRALPALGELHS